MQQRKVKKREGPSPLSHGKGWEEGPGDETAQWLLLLNSECQTATSVPSCLISSKLQTIPEVGIIHLNFVDKENGVHRG